MDADGKLPIGVYLCASVVSQCIDDAPSHATERQSRPEAAIHLAIVMMNDRRVGANGLQFSPPEILKGFHHSARGCAQRATPGHTSNKRFYPEGDLCKRDVFELGSVMVAAIREHFGSRRLSSSLILAFTRAHSRISCCFLRSAPHQDPHQSFEVVGHRFEC